MFITAEEQQNSSSFDHQIGHGFIAKLQLFDHPRVSRANGTGHRNSSVAFGGAFSEERLGKCV